MIRVKGKAYGKVYDYKCTLISRSDQRMIVETKSKPKHRIEIRPRYAGSKIGTDDFLEIGGSATGGAATLCGMSFDGEYVALALFKERGKNIEIIPHEY